MVHTSVTNAFWGLDTTPYMFVSDERTLFSSCVVKNFYLLYFCKNCVKRNNKVSMIDYFQFFLLYFLFPITPISGMRFVLHHSRRKTDIFFFIMNTSEVQYHRGREGWSVIFFRKVMLGSVHMSAGRDNKLYGTINQIIVSYLKLFIVCKKLKRFTFLQNRLCRRNHVCWRQFIGMTRTIFSI